MSGFKKTPLITAALLLLSGCFQAPDSGHYEGFLITSEHLQIAASVDVKRNGDTAQCTVDLLGEQNPILLKVVGDSHTVTVSSDTGFIANPITFRSSHDDCYESAAKDEICSESNRIRIRFSQVAAGGSAEFVFDAMPAASRPKTMEKPKSYSLHDLVARAKDQSFESRVEFEEKVIKGKLTAQQSILNLLPHFNINDGLSFGGMILAPSPASYLAMGHVIGDIVPFVLPSRWFQTGAAQERTAADLDAYKIVQADTMNVVENLALSVLRDTESLKTLEIDQEAIIHIRDMLLSQEKKGSQLVQVGTSDQIEAVLLQTDQTVNALETAIEDEKAALSQASGFMNPHAVSDVLPITTPDALCPDDLTVLNASTETQTQTIAVQRSLALMQLDHLIEAARRLSHATIFEWLDPSGDPNASIGLGLITHIKLSKANVQEGYLQKDSAQSKILLEVSDTFTSSNSVDANLHNDQAQSTTNQHTIDRLLFNLKNSTGDMTSLTTALAAALAQKAMTDVAQVGDRYAQIILHQQMDFLTYSGIYSQLLEEKP